MIENSQYVLFMTYHLFVQYIRIPINIIKPNYSAMNVIPFTFVIDRQGIDSLLNTHFTISNAIY